MLKRQTFYTDAVPVAPSPDNSVHIDLKTVACKEVAEVKQTFVKSLRTVWRVRVMVFNATFSNFFSYIVAVSFNGGENRSTQRKPPTCHKCTLWNDLICFL
jgi:hypothetical protein